MICPYCDATERHVCQSAEIVRSRWENLLKRLGSYELERKIQRRELSRLYNRRWPFDQTTKALPLEAAESYSSHLPSPHEALIMQQAADEYLGRLTPLQRDVADRLVEGYKPRDIAQMNGKSNSGSVRWLKFSIKKKLKQDARDDDMPKV